MQVKINCIYNDRGAWCKNIRVKRSLLGFGARCCMEWSSMLNLATVTSIKKCPYKFSYDKPEPPPPPKPRQYERVERTNIGEK